MNTKKEEAYSSEVGNFCKGLGNVVFESQAQLEDFITEEAKYTLPVFKYDSRFSSKNILVFSKPFFLNWKVIISIDRGQLSCYFTPSWDGLEKNNRLYIDLALCHEKNRTGKKKYQLLPLYKYVLFSRYEIPWFYKNSNELKTHLLYELTCFKYELDFFEKPIFEVFSDLDAIGYSN